MNLRIAWLSPWNEKSAIAQFGSHIVAEMESRGIDVEIFRTEVGTAMQLNSRQAKAPVRFLSEVPDALLHEFDMIVANLGNYHAFHGAMLKRLETLGFIAIFHDKIYPDLVWGEAMSSPNVERYLKNAVTTMYGMESWAGSYEAVVKTRPMIEWLAGSALAAVVHGEHYRSLVESVCPGPVVTLPLVLEFDGLSEPKPIEEDLVIASVGMANPNKRIDQIIQGIATSQVLRRVCRVMVIGDVQETERARLTALAKSCRVQPPHFTGWLADPELLSLLDQVDVLSCLRHPVSEGASGSLLLSLRSGKPTLVSNQGIYAELPDGIVMRCAAGYEAKDVGRHLLDIVRDPVTAQKMGERARRYIAEVHTRKRYVDGLLSLIDSAIGLSPVLQTALSLGAYLGTLGVSEVDPVVGRVSEMLDTLFRP